MLSTDEIITGKPKQISVFLMSNIEIIEKNSEDKDKEMQFCPICNSGPAYMHTWNPLRNRTR